MEITTLFFVFLTIAVLGIVGAIINMIVAMNNRDPFGSVGGLAARHMFFGLLWVVGGLGSLISGIIWVVRQFS
jgi:hypothetical protein